MISEISVIKKSDVKLRNTYDMMNDILFCCSQNWIAKSNLRDYVGITSSRRYLITILFEKELLNKRENPNQHGIQYKISGKGLRFCKVYYEMMGLIK